MKVQAEISLYPLKTANLSESIERFCRIVRENGCEIIPGNMSTLVRGDTEFVFHAVQQAFQTVADNGQVVMTMKISNACPNRVIG